MWNAPRVRGVLLLFTVGPIPIRVDTHLNALACHNAVPGHTFQNKKAGLSIVRPETGAPRCRLLTPPVHGGPLVTMSPMPSNTSVPSSVLSE